MGGGQSTTSTAKEKSVVFITGCTDGGIGASMAREFARVGFEVVATSRSLDSMKQLCTNDRIHPRVLDVTDFEAAKASVESVVAEHGHIDILVNNAGVPCVAPIAELPLSMLDSTYRTNIYGPLVLIQSVVPHMVARGKGRIVNVGSITSVACGPWSGGYTSSKSALEALTDALRMELKPFGINVVLILPGAIRSNIRTKALSMFESELFQGLKLYKSFEPALASRVNLPQVKNFTSSDEFAKNVVPRILSKSPPAHHASGRLSTLFFFLYYTPIVIRDYIFAKSMGLDRKATITDKKAN